MSAGWLDAVMSTTWFGGARGDRLDAQIDHDVGILKVPACRDGDKQRDALHHVPFTPRSGTNGKLVIGAVWR